MSLNGASAQHGRHVCNTELFPMPKALGKNYGPLIRSRSNATQKSESSFTVFLLLKLKGRSGKKSEPRRKCIYCDGDDGDDDYDVADDAV